jgi:L-alanine-DL-glutamate epimerase-like enolase superfamily enzyme
MTTIAEVRADHYLIKLPVTLSDSTHGQMTHFELVTVRIRDERGREGTGYTFTVGANGAAVHATVQRDLAPRLVGERADLIEALWKKMWWTLHYGGRGGTAAMAISAVDIALWDLKGRSLGVPLWTLLGGDDPKVPCYAGGIDLHFPLDRLLAQTDDNLQKGFRAIKMKVGRPQLSEDVARVKAMREHLGADFPLMVDANMRWTPDEAIRAARALQPFQPVWLEEPTIPDDVPGHVRIVREGGLARGHRREPAHAVRVRPHDPGRRRDFSRAGRDQLRRDHGVHEGGAARRGLQPARDLARRP